MRSLNKYISATERISSIDDYINEKFQIGNDYKRQYAYTPKNKDELIEVIQGKIEKEGLGTKDNPLDLNDIDTSKITDMSELFDGYDGELKELSDNGHFDISDWNVSSVINMYCMFHRSNFDGDISDWDVSNVKDMKYMFWKSNFNGNISKWDVSGVEDIHGMFAYSSFNGNISNWDVSKVRNMSGMFYGSKFNGNIEKWDIGHVRSMEYMFTNCPIENNPPKWYRE